jgi:serine/threonine protein kinase
LIPLCERTVIAGKYRLERELAVGGMGAVWVARHLQLDEPVAVKFMRATVPELADARGRFAREARAAARLRGPHVVEVLDHGVDGDVPYIVMELLEGEHLGERLRRERRLSLGAAASIAAQVSKALGRAHQAGIVHRDLKPANVFLARLDGEEIVKILDFGIHKTLYGKGSEVTGTDVLMGSPQYMSPEQARGSRSVDHRADLWSLGAILYRAVTGTPAFDGVSAVDVIVHICTGPLPVASRAAPDLPSGIDAFFLRALAREPERRFSSAREMTDAFSALVERAERGDHGERSGRGRRPIESSEDLLTSIMDRRASEPPRPAAATAVPGAPVNGASLAEIDAFVERAFGALLQGDAGRPRLASVADSVPPTTRCAAVRATLPAPAHAACAPLAPLPMRAALERLAPGSFGDPPPSPPAASALMARGRRVAVEERGTVATLIDQGFSALRRGEADTARRAWEEALGLDPHNRALALNLRRLSNIGGQR